MNDERSEIKPQLESESKPESKTEILPKGSERFWEFADNWNPVLNPMSATMLFIMFGEWFAYDSVDFYVRNSWNQGILGIVMTASVIGGGILVTALSKIRYSRNRNKKS